ncbi:MAG: hypothetical protein U1D06_03255 [Paracoccaceae bacterium]|nr:hypothetical protein [Paracoccaceae bacterium]
MQKAKWQTLLGMAAFAGKNSGFRIQMGKGTMFSTLLPPKQIGAKKPRRFVPVSGFETSFAVIWDDFAPFLEHHCFYLQRVVPAAIVLLEGHK